jgi:hypothetical protein
MAKLQTTGTCLLCQGTFGKAAMSRHLAKCLATHDQADPAMSKRAPKQVQLFHLVVQGTHNPQYWLHLEVPATATLYDLDDFLRNIWLECCDHLSQFNFKKAKYSGAAFDDFGGGFEEEDENMDIKLGKILTPKLTFDYEYDFGSTTKLGLKVVSDRVGKAPKEKPIRLLARNEAPATPCGTCGSPASFVNSNCSWEPDSWVCNQCLKKQDEDEEMFLPVVNSPRVGVCAYGG